MKRARWIYLLALVASAVFCIANGRWLSWILFLAVLALPWLSLLLSLPAMFSARMTLLVPTHLQVGFAACVSAPIQSKWLELPAAVKLTVSKPLTGETWELRSGEDLPTAHCGGLIITPKKANCCDLLGLWSRRLKNIQPVRVYIMPQAKKQTEPTGLEQHLSVVWRPKPGGGFSEQHELREYRPGDNLNQIHWKLSAKTGDLIIREPMEPLRSRMLLTLDLSGEPAVLDEKLGRLLWLGQHLLSQNLCFSVLALTGEGPLEQAVGSQQELQTCLETLLCTPCSTTGTILTHNAQADWRCHIGGDADEV